MFKNKNNSTDAKQADKVSRSVVTKTVEKTGGVQTTTTTIKSCTKDDFESVFQKLNLDPEKFQSGGTSVTKTIVYTDSSGRKEVMEETVETYGDPDKMKKKANSKDTGTNKKDSKNSGINISKLPNVVPMKAGGNKTVKEDKEKVSASSMTPDQFQKECLKAHNDYRANHGVSSLTLSKEICAYAQEWANELAALDTFKHRKDNKYGENIFMKWSSDPNHMISGKEPVDSWYSEIKDHQFGVEPTSLKSGHFTQVIWKGSLKMGVAYAKSKSGKILVVANYDPAGNFVGKFAQNVPPPKK